MTLRKLCNHPDLVTNDYSELVKLGEENGEGDFTMIDITRKKKSRKKRSEGEVVVHKQATIISSLTNYKITRSLQYIASLVPSLSPTLG